MIVLDWIAAIVLDWIAAIVLDWIAGYFESRFYYEAEKRMPCSGVQH